VPCPPPSTSRSDKGQYQSGGTTRLRDYKSYGALRAIDPLTGDRKWEFRYTTSSSSGVLTTASGLVFSGDGDGNIIALDSGVESIC
jgi:alcohol dehydrogenase (cytochrome c)